MAIDYSIQYDCEPRRNFTSDGILDRLKLRDRAAMIIRMYRENGDERPPSEMGYEFTRSTPEGESETELMVVQDVLDQANQLDTFAHHCRGCPANRLGTPYGCSGFIQYPISGAAEAWLLNQLPLPHEAPLVWLLIKQGVEQFVYDGSTIQPLRATGVTYFEDRVPALRGLGEFTLTADQVFEMIFGVGDIAPNHAGMLLLFFNGIERNIEADHIMNLSPAPADADDRYPFLMRIMPDDDRTIAELKDFFHTLYIAWRLNVSVRMDI